MLKGRVGWLQTLYKRVCQYMELDDRVEVLNNRLMVRCLSLHCALATSLTTPLAFLFWRLSVDVYVCVKRGKCSPFDSHMFASRWKWNQYAQ